MDIRFPLLNNHAPARKRSRRRSLSVSYLFLQVVFFISILVFIQTPFLALEWSGRPFLGFVVEQSLVVADITGSDWSGRSLGLGHPHRVVQLGASRIESLEDFHAKLETLSPGMNIGVHTILPDGREFLFPAVLVSEFPREDLLRLFWLPYGVSIAFLFIGLWVFVLRGRTQQARAFSYFCASFALTSGLLFDLISTHYTPALWTVVIAQQGGALFGLGLLFPEEWSQVKKQRWLSYLPYTLSIGLSIWGLVALYDRADPWAYVLPWRMSYFYAAAGILLFISMTLHRLASSASPVSRQQARIILWGVVFAFAPVSVWLIAPLLGVNMVWNPAVYLPFLLIFPLAVSIAILRYRLWDVGVIINRALVYSTLTALLAGIYLALVMLLQVVLSSFTGMNSQLAVAGSTLTVAALFNPARRRIQSFIDRRFYRSKYDAAKTLASFGASLQEEVDLRKLIEQLEQVIREALQPAYIFSWLSNGNEFSIQNQLDNGSVLHKGARLTIRSVRSDDAMVDFLRSAPGAMEVNRVLLASSAMRSFKFAGVKVLLPLKSQGELVGWLTLGPRLNERDYSADDRALLTNLATQATPAVRVAQLVRQQQNQALERERMEHELHIARLIQYTLLPEKLPDLPGWQMAAHYQPARAVGGDFYDFIHFDDGRLGLFIGDVADKGIPAALVMSTTLSLLRAAARQTTSPGEILGRVNDLLVEDTLPGMFVTCLFVVLDLQNGQLRFANAGHNLCYCRKDDGVVSLRARGMPLGLMPDMVYEEHDFQVDAGDFLLLYSDGLIEAHDPRGEMFGSERLISLIADHSEDSAQLLGQILGNLAAFTGDGWEQEDDLTLVAMTRQGNYSNGFRTSVDLMEKTNGMEALRVKGDLH
jgi:serine phosphatase RsbU (regulator of sigma subunit)